LVASFGVQKKIINDIAGSGLKDYKFADFESNHKCAAFILLSGIWDSYE
jgi:hypothetical protein